MNYIVSHINETPVSQGSQIQGEFGGLTLTSDTGIEYQAGNNSGSDVFTYIRKYEDGSIEACELTANVVC